MGQGRGKGYKNMMGTDSRIHSLSSRGIKQPQRINPLLNDSERKQITVTVGKSGLRGIKALEYAEILAKKKIEKNKVELTDRQKANRNYEAYIIESINSDDYDADPKTKKEKLQFLKDNFKSEYGFMIARVGEQNAFKEWISGLPSSFNIEFMNYKILLLAKKMGSLPENATDKQEDKVLENYWNFMANKTFQTFRKYGVQ